MAWRRIGVKPLSEPMLTRFTDIYMRTKGRWIKDGSIYISVYKRATVKLLFVLEEIFQIALVADAMQSLWGLFYRD